VHWYEYDAFGTDPHGVPMAQTDLAGELELDPRIERSV
jgi:hypothetical protein